MKRLLCLVALSLAVPGCASRYKLDANAPTYAAMAKIRVKVNKTNNREVEITIEHLAPPQRIPGGYRGYAVWFRVPGHGVVKAGLLDYNEKKRRGKLEATTPHEKFEVLITLEQDTSVQQPSNMVIVNKIVGAA
jgi:hypothetical protein